MSVDVLVMLPDGSLQAGGAELLQQQHPGGTHLWVDLCGDAAEHSAYLQACSFHPLAIDDAFTINHQPKVEDYDNTLFVIARGIDFNLSDDRLRTLKLAAFLRPDHLVTYHPRPMKTTTTVRTRLVETKNAPPGGCAHLLYLLFSQLMELYNPLVDRVVEGVEELEDEIFDEPSEKHLTSILQMRRQLSSMRRVMLPHREVFSHLASSTSTLLDERERLYFRDTFDQVFRLTDSIDMQREQLGGVRDTYLSLVSQRTNEVMKTLTILSAILLPLTFLAGLYGMNFQHMPELTSRYGYPALLAVMALTAGGLTLWFKKRGWF